jgi:hypothetical protein
VVGAAAAVATDGREAAIMAGVAPHPAMRAPAAAAAIRHRCLVAIIPDVAAFFFIEGIS